MLVIVLARITQLINPDIYHRHGRSPTHSVKRRNSVWYKFSLGVNTIHLRPERCPSPSLPFPITASKALDSVECFLFVEPVIRIIKGEVSTLVAPAILFAKDWF
jgi:hypothetical protein